MAVEAHGWTLRADRHPPSEVVASTPATARGRPWRRAGGLSYAPVTVLLTAEGVVIASRSGPHIQADIDALTGVSNTFNLLELRAANGKVTLEGKADALATIAHQLSMPHWGTAWSRRTPSDLTGGSAATRAPDGEPARRATVRALHWWRSERPPSYEAADQWPPARLVRWICLPVFAPLVAPAEPSQVFFAVHPSAWTVLAGVLIVMGLAQARWLHRRYHAAAAYTARSAGIPRRTASGAWRGEVDVRLADGRVVRVPLSARWLRPGLSARVALVVNGEPLRQHEDVPPGAEAHAVDLQAAQRYAPAVMFIALGGLLLGAALLPA
jgi:hypothetical protein